MIENIISKMILTNRIFYANILSQMERKEDNTIPTLGSYIKDNKFYLIYNSDFLKKHNIEEQMAFLEHEILHIIFGHSKYHNYQNRPLWNVAEDIAINQFIDKNLIKEGCHYDNFNLPPKLSSEEYYVLLLKQAPKLNTTGCGRPYNELSDVEKAHVMDMVKKELARGVVPSEIKRQVEDLLDSPKISWKSIIRQTIGSTVTAEKRQTWKRPNRRFGEMTKGAIKDKICKITIGIDTSGSIDEKQLSLFLNELKSIQQCYKNKFKVIECDVVIHNVYELDKYKPINKQVKGGGGTDFRPMFEYCDKERTNLFILFTDCYGEWPKNTPKYKVLFCVVGDDYNKTIPFGKVLKINEI